MKLFLIANPAAGHSARQKVQQAIDILGADGRTVGLHWTAQRGDATELARQAVAQQADLVVAVGGDGTLNEVVHALAGTSVPLGVIPLGTANCFALETGIPLDSGEAARSLLTGRPMRIHLGQADDGYFLLMAGVGFDADIVYRVEQNLASKKRLGKLAYVSQGFLRVVRYHPARLKIILDGREELEAYSVVVGNTRYFGGRFVITPQAGFDKAELDVCLFQGKSRRDMVRYAWGIVRGRHLEQPDVLYRKARKVEVQADEGRAHVQVDGDYWGTTPVRFRIVPDALTVLLPQKKES